MGKYFKIFMLKMKKDLQKKATKDKNSKIITGKNGGKIWKGK